LIERLADAGNRTKAGGERSRNLAAHRDVRFTEERAPLGVPHDHVLHSCFAEHGAAHLTCVCTLALPEHVLRGDADVAVPRSLGGGVDRNERGRQHDLDSVEVLG
jgi:hypothetical protein